MIPISMVVVICGVAVLMFVLMRSNSNTNNSMSLQNPNMNITVGRNNKSTVMTKQSNKAENTDKFESSNFQEEN